MIINLQVPLHRLVLSLSEALDHVSPAMADHQLRVAYISTRMARVLGYRGQLLRDLFHAAALHDIGLIQVEDRLRLVGSRQLEGLEWHGEAGYELLKDNEFFAPAAPIVRHHHAEWREGRGKEVNGQPVPAACHIVALADAADRLIRRDVPILEQAKSIVERIVSGGRRHFCPECVRAFREVSEAPAFWLDAASRRIYTILGRAVDWPTLVINEGAVQGIAQVFGRLVDGLSPWTATHSAGVAATAVALSERLNFSPREQVLMRAAGYLHDLGKVTVSSSILDKRGKLTPEQWAVVRGHTYVTFHVLDTIGGMPQISEWAAFHHERLDGKGYPFGHGSKDLTLGARIMGVADTFTAITEDRPYRKGMDSKEATAVLGKLVDNGGLDGDVVAALVKDLDRINSIRRREQVSYAVKQRQLSAVMSQSQPGANSPG